MDTTDDSNDNISDDYEYDRVPRKPRSKQIKHAQRHDYDSDISDDYEYDPIPRQSKSVKKMSKVLANTAERPNLSSHGNGKKAQNQRNPTNSKAQKRRNPGRRRGREKLKSVETINYEITVKHENNEQDDMELEMEETYKVKEKKQDINLKGDNTYKLKFIDSHKKQNKKQMKHNANPKTEVNDTEGKSNGRRKRQNNKSKGKSCEVISGTAQTKGQSKRKPLIQTFDDFKENNHSDEYDNVQSCIKGIVKDLPNMINDTGPNSSSNCKYTKTQTQTNNTEENNDTSNTVDNHDDDSSDTVDYIDGFYVGQTDGFSDDDDHSNIRDETEKSDVTVKKTKQNEEMTQSEVIKNDHDNNNTENHIEHYNEDHDNGCLKSKLENMCNIEQNGSQLTQVKWQKNKTERRKNNNGMHASTTEYNGDKSTTYQCEADNCEKVFSSKFKMKEHFKRKHSSDHHMKCDVCGRHYVYLAHLTAHKLVHVDENPYECWICNRCFKTPYYLKQHVRKVHNITDTGVPAEYRARISLQKKKKKKREEYVCKAPNCQMVFPSARKLHYHFARHHRIKKFQCNECGSAFPYQSGLDRHRSRHSILRSQVNCWICPQGFTTVYSLKRHLEGLHNISQNNIPAEYQKYFKQDSQSINESNIRKSIRTVSHETTYTGLKNIVCDVCGKTITHSYFKQHMATHTGQTRWQCEDCGKGFYRKTDYRTHMRLHSGEKPYKCDQCLKSFRLRQSLRHHLKIHAGLKPYECQICGRAFNRRDTLLSHARSQHHGQGLPWKHKSLAHVLTGGPKKNISQTQHPEHHLNSHAINCNNNNNSQIQELGHNEEYQPE